MNRAEAIASRIAEGARKLQIEDKILPPAVIDSGPCGGAFRVDPRTLEALIAIAVSAGAMLKDCAGSDSKPSRIDSETRKWRVMYLYPVERVKALAADLSELARKHPEDA